MLLWCRPGSDLNALPAQLLQPPTSHSPILRKTNSQPHPTDSKSPGPSAKAAGKRQPSPPSSVDAAYHPRAQSIPTGSVAGSGTSGDAAAILAVRAQSIPSGDGSSGDAAMVAARADRLKADDHKSRSKSGSPRQVDYYWSTSQRAAASRCVFVKLQCRLIKPQFHYADFPETSPRGVLRGSFGVSNHRDMSIWFEKFPWQVGNKPVYVGETGKSATSRANQRGCHGFVAVVTGSRHSGIWALSSTGPQYVLRFPWDDDAFNAIYTVAFNNIIFTTY